MLEAAASDQGIALARSVLVTYDLATGGLVRLFNIGIPSGGAHYAIHLPVSATRPEVRAVVDWLAATPGDMPPGRI